MTRQHYLGDDHLSFLWLLSELGAQGLSGDFLRGDQVVYTPRVDEKGYVAPRDKRDDDGPAQVVALTPDALSGQLVLNRYEIFRTLKSGRSIRVLFPDYISRKVLVAACRGEAPNLRLLHGITHTPMVRADGSVLAEPGYDTATGFLHLPTVDVPPVPERPRAADRRRAR
jgi:hypothetical protein